jgi:hypothetical protein
MSQVSWFTDGGSSAATEDLLYAGEARRREGWAHELAARSTSLANVSS